MKNLVRLDAAAIIKAVLISIVAGIVIGGMTGFMGFGVGVAGILTDDMVKTSIILQGFLFCLGQLPNFIAGYFAAAFAGRNELMHGVVVGAVLLAIEGLFYLVPDEAPFTLLNGFSLLLSVPVAVAGSVVCRRTQ